ncbi:MAG: hypothetical protein H6607_12050 [Flavobacteriales bacterium]|nr:hypothetical protein [Flavobacteriales bacterium]
MKGKFYAHWGWNEDWYTKSDIRLHGSDYDFTLYDVKANDRQTPFSWASYFLINQISIPQTNLDLGYYFKENYSISAGFDHMKYVMPQDQTVAITGNISRAGSEYSGIYNNDSIQLTREFLRYEHTNGLNYVFLEINRHDQWLNLFNSNLKIGTSMGISPALLRPRTDVWFLRTHGPNVFHNAGYGINAKLGLNVILWKHFNLTTEIKGGYINMPNIRATADKEDLAQQHFGFLQANFLIGGTFDLIKLFK